MVATVNAPASGFFSAMVTEFVALSPKHEEDSNEEDAFRNEGVDKALASETSDEETTSSSLLPIPNTLDKMRNELKSTLNNFCGTDFESDEPNVMVNELKYPTEIEMSIARKITSANLLLDDLLNNTNVFHKHTNAIVFNASTDHQKGRNLHSETVTDQDESTTSTEYRHTIPVTPFIFPPTVCECSRCPCERKEAANEGTEQSEKIVQPQQLEPKKSRRRFSLSEKIRLMRLKCRKNKKESLVQQTQTDPTSENIPRFSCPCQNFTMDEDKCTCGDYSSPDPECTCPQVITPRKERRSSSQKEVKQVQETQSIQQRNVSNKVSEVINKPPSGTNTSGNVNHLQIKDGAISQQAVKNSVPAIPVESSKRRERIDIYYFDHGNSAYYRTTDSHPAKFTEYMIERTDEYATKFWAEIFGTITIAIAFIISFILQLYRCLFTAIIRALTVGLIQIFSDYFFKPLLTVIFNGLIQPCLILGYNIATSTKDFCVPICEICEFCAKDLSIIFRSCRVVEINQTACSAPSCPCRHKV